MKSSVYSFENSIDSVKLLICSAAIFYCCTANVESPYIFGYTITTIQGYDLHNDKIFLHRVLAGG